MKYKLLILGIFLISKLYGQEKRKILDKETGLPISYVTVKVLNFPKGTIGSATGDFALNIGSKDTLLLSCAGYENTKITGKDIKNIIYMEPRVIELNPVFVSSKKFIGKVLIGNENKITKGHFTWGPSIAENYDEFAQKIILPKSGSFLKINKVFVPFKKLGKCVGPFLLRIYYPDTLNNQPGIEALNRVIGETDVLNKKNVLVADISSNNLLFNESDSFYVSISWPPEAFPLKCKTGIPMSKLSNSQTYTRTFATYSFHWFPFGKIKDSNGVEFEVKTFLSIEADVYQ